MARPLWFKRKTYGWGWTPATWQGWAIVGIYTGGILSLAVRLDETDPNGWMNFFMPLIGMTLVLLVITYLTGEKPRWQWGQKPTDATKYE